MSTPKTQKLTLKRIVENLGAIPAKGFSEETPKLTPDQKKKLMEMAGQFENLGAAIRREEAIVNSARSLTELCELAEMYALNECGDWFSQEIVKKDMKSLKQRVAEYNKCAKEAYARMQQLGVLYEDIGHVLGRYYDLKSMAKQQPEAQQQGMNGVPNVAGNPGKQALQAEQESDLKALEPAVQQNVTKL
jgi:hypothetical protein